MKGSDNLEDVGVDREVMLKWFIMEDGRAWCELI
jgi:hypothetical protein